MSDLTQFEQVISSNSIYQQYEARWRFLLESYEGGETYRKGKHLTRYQLETDAEYQARLQATPLDNQCKGIISTYISFLFRDEVERDFGSIANLPELADFLDDADLDNRDLDSFMKEVAIWSNVFGHAWVIVSKPNIGAVTKADEIAANVRPYVSLITPLTVIDWNWTRTPSGRYELDFLKYVEEINGNIQVIKAWTKDLITTSEVDLHEKVIRAQFNEVNQLGKIPAVIAYNQRGHIRGIGTSAINDIADQQRYIYNVQSEIEQSMRMDSHPSLVKTPDTQAGIGPGSIILMPDNMDPNLKPYVLEFAGGNITNFHASIEHSVAAIERIANIGSVRATVSTKLSGVAMETEFTLLNSKLAEMADNLELAEEMIWRLFCEYQAQPFDVEVDYPDSFAIHDKSREITDLQTLSTCGSTDPRVLAGITASILDLLELDTDELATITDPELLNPESVQEPGELPPDEMPVMMAKSTSGNTPAA
jgi:hypothetical protein